MNPCVVPKSYKEALDRKIGIASKLCNQIKNLCTSPEVKASLTSTIHSKFRVRKFGSGEILTNVITLYLC